MPVQVLDARSHAHAPGSRHHTDETRQLVKRRPGRLRGFEFAPQLAQNGFAARNPAAHRSDPALQSRNLSFDACGSAHVPLLLDANITGVATSGSPVKKISSRGEPKCGESLQTRTRVR